MKHFLTSKTNSNISPSLRSMAVLVERTIKVIKAVEGRVTARRLGREQFLFVSRLRRSCARLDNTAMLRMLHQSPEHNLYHKDDWSSQLGSSFLQVLPSYSKGLVMVGDI